MAASERRFCVYSTISVKRDTSFINNKSERAMQKICLKDFLTCLSGNFVADFEQTSYRKLYLEPCQTSKVVKIFILAKIFISEILKGPEFASEFLHLLLANDASYFPTTL